MENKIYFFHYGGSRNYCRGFAVTDDGELLKGHMSSDMEFLKYDLGFIKGHRDIEDLFRGRFPEGFVKEWIDEPISHEVCSRFISENKISPRSAGKPGRIRS